MFIRPCVAYDNKVKKIIGAILVLIFFVMAITVFVGYFIMGIKSADSSLWPFGLKLTFGLCFLILVIIGLYKLLQDMKIPEEDGR
jgi:uncharacterized membrane protein (DUF373 family)